MTTQVAFKATKQGLSGVCGVIVMSIFVLTAIVILGGA